MMVHSATRRPALRLALLAGVVLGCGVLFFGTGWLGFELTLLGVGDEALRPAAHLGGYGLLAGCLAYVVGQRYRLAWLLSVLLATVEELHQLSVPGRYATLGDWLVNIVGISTVLLTLGLIMPCVRYRMERRRYRQALIAEGEWRPWQLYSAIAMTMALAVRRRPRPAQPIRRLTPSVVPIRLSDRRAADADKKVRAAA